MKFTSGALNEQAVWKIILVTALCYYIGEAFPVEHSLWAYYDYQPLWIWRGTALPTWSMPNATSMLTSSTLMLFALPHLKGIRQVLLVPLAVSGTPVRLQMKQCEH